MDGRTTMVPIARSLLSIPSINMLLRLSPAPLIETEAVGRRSSVACRCPTHWVPRPGAGHALNEADEVPPVDRQILDFAFRHERADRR